MVGDVYTSPTYFLTFLENSDIIYIESEEKGKVIIMNVEALKL